MLNNECYNPPEGFVNNKSNLPRVEAPQDGVTVGTSKNRVGALTIFPFSAFYQRCLPPLPADSHCPRGDWL